MWQKIVIYNGTKYLGVQMNEYRASGIDALYDEITDNGYYRLNVYWFKYEPIKWRLLTTSGNSAFIMSDIALDFFSIPYDVDFTHEYLLQKLTLEACGYTAEEMNANASITARASGD